MPPDPAPPLPTGAAKWAAVGTALLSFFVFALGTRGTALQTEQINQDFVLDRYTSQWVTGPTGVLGLVAMFSAIHFVKVFGVRRMFLAGAACLTVGSLGAALARDAWQFGLAEGVRAFTSLYAIPGLTLLMQLLPRHRGMVYCTCLAMVYGGEVLAEPIGSLVDYNPSWRALFVGMAASGVWMLLCGLFLLPDDRPAARPAHAFDWPGVLLFAASLGLVFFLLFRGNYLGWLVATPVWVAAAALVVAVALFVGRELVAPEPFIDLSMFAYRTVAVAMLSAAFWCAALFGVAVHLPNYMLLRGYEHWKTGLVMLPMGVLVMAAMLLGGLVRDRARYVWMLRLGLAGMTVVGFALARVDLYTSWQWLASVTGVWAVFAGVCLPAYSRLGYEGQRPAAAAATGAMKFFMRAFGGTVGVLAAGVLLDRASAWGLDYVRDSVTLGQGALEVTEPEVRDHMVRHGCSPPEAAAQAQALLNSWVHLHAQVIGYRIALHFCACLSAVALVVACFISTRKETSLFDEDA